jgi:hypothetical protein
MFKWLAMALADTGQPVYLPVDADKSIQVVGTLGAAGACTIEGSNMDGTPTYAALNNPQGTALTFTALGIKEILENTYLVRPNITAGDGTTNLNVYMVVKE